MKKYLVCALVALNASILCAQDRLFFHKTDGISWGALTGDVDSVSFLNKSVAKVYFRNTLTEFPLQELDSITLEPDSRVVSICYNDHSARVINPFAFEGISVQVSGSEVTVHSTIDSKNVTYRLSGTSSEGMFKLYSDNAVGLTLSNLTLTHSDGPAINIQSKKSTNVVLEDGTTNSLTDGSTYATPAVTGGIVEDQKAAFFSEGTLRFSGNGSLTLCGKGLEAHALCTDEKLEINGGTLNITSSCRDGLHGQEGIVINGGTLTLTSTGSCLDGDNGAITIHNGTLTATCTTESTNLFRCDSTYTQDGGNVQLTLSGKQSRGIKCNQDFTLNGGKITVNASGGAVLEALATGYDPAYSAAIKSKQQVRINAGEVVITHTGSGGKGISADEGYTQTGGNVTVTVSGSGSVYVDAEGANDYYTASAINSDGPIRIQGGISTLTASGVASKAISSDLDVRITGGTLTLKPQGAAVLVPLISNTTRFNPKYGTGIKSGTTTVLDSTAAVTIAMTGAGAKGISTGTDFTMNAGSLSITSSGNGAQYVNSTGATDGYQSTCITTDGNLNILGGTVSTYSSGTAGKGLNGGTGLTLGTPTSAPTVSVTTTGASIGTTTSGGGGGGFPGGSTSTVYASAKAINSNGNIAVENGTVTVSSANDGIKSETGITFNNAKTTITTSYEGIEAPLITFNNGTTSVTSTNDCINGTYGTTAGGTESNDNSLITFNGGTVLANMSGSGDALDCNGNMILKGGSVVLQGPSSQPELAVDYNGSFTVSGGFMIGGGPNSGSMIEPTSSKYTSTNTYCLFCTSTSTVGAGTFFHVQDASGNDIVTYKPTRAAYYLFVIAPAFTSGSSYSVYTGGSYTAGTSSNGLYTGGTYSGGTLKKTVSMSTSKFVSTSF
jgi:hypothetical protein